MCGLFFEQRLLKQVCTAMVVGIYFIIKEKWLPCTILTPHFVLHFVDSVCQLSRNFLISSSETVLNLFIDVFSEFAFSRVLFISAINFSEFSDAPASCIIECGKRINHLINKKYPHQFLAENLNFHRFLPFLVLLWNLRAHPIPSKKRLIILADVYVYFISWHFARKIFGVILLCYLELSFLIFLHYID